MTMFAKLKAWAAALGRMRVVAVVLIVLSICLFLYLYEVSLFELILCGLLVWVGHQNRHDPTRFITSMSRNFHFGGVLRLCVENFIKGIQK